MPISSIVIKNDTSSVRKGAKKDKITTAVEEKFECVFVKNGETAKLKVIKTGIQDDTNIEITEGLSEGDEVITGPYNLVTKTLKTGDKVISEDQKNTKEKAK